MDAHTGKLYVITPVCERVLQGVDLIVSGGGGGSGSSGGLELPAAMASCGEDFGFLPEPYLVRGSLRDGDAVGGTRAIKSRNNLARPPPAGRGRGRGRGGRG